MLEDRRRIQTAVLGDAASEVPLLLPLEAIEVDAFRKEHAGDTFWCGLLLGGCGGQLTTKLYTDRVCHFAHHPDPDGLPHVCERRARDVSSADHLYFKAAAMAWLAGRGERVRFTFTQPDGLPVGSLLDIAFEREGRAPRVHLDPAITPEWNEEAIEPVLGMSVPVDDDTLIRRWYVHRVRFDSQGTSRQVRIGTAAFARPTEWFGLDDCEMTDDGLQTPAVDRIIRSRRTVTVPSGASPRQVERVTARAIAPLESHDALVRALGAELERRQLRSVDGEATAANLDGSARVAGVKWPLVDAGGVLASCLAEGVGRLYPRHPLVRSVVRAYGGLSAWQGRDLVLALVRAERGR